MPWEIAFTSEAERWFKGLDDLKADQIAGALQRLEELGPNLGRPAADRVKESAHHNMKELRAFGGHQRALFAFDHRRVAVVLIGGDKTDNWKGWYRENVPKADRLFTEHLRRHGKEGPWRDPGGRSGGRER